MKTRWVALVALALPSSVFAQQAANTANPVTSAFTRRIGFESRNIEQAFDSIPESKFSYKPTPAQLSFGYIAQHVADDNYAFCDQFGDMKSNVSDKEKNTPDSVKATWPKDTLVAQLKASFDFCEKAMAQLQDSKLGDEVSLTYEGKTYKQSRVAMVLGHALDLADHYSQLANYMRLNGWLPPTALPRKRGTA
ncbi:MAG TPA: DinB family protein [Gemmatimonadaceae bacterium]|nr:DinB family protein [Gemmatimonadaceae bacterium]